jgi:glycosyltransferase involved in cell wall biosynthesis
MIMDKMVLLILPTYQHLEYARQTAESFFKATPNGRMILVDDCSPDYEKEDWDKWQIRRDLFWRCQFTEHAGSLTRSWNHGLWLADGGHYDYAICGNSDLIFTRNWFDGIQKALETYDLVGPLTNAPGHRKEQAIQRWLADFEVKDDHDYLDTVADRIHGAGAVRTYGLNGFCMVAKTATWWANPFNEREVFDPAYPLAGNEDELQCRWREAGRTFGISIGSLVWHYRGVSRGLKVHKDGSFRMQKPEAH